jgi:hypothetical protein
VPPFSHYFHMTIVQEHWFQYVTPMRHLNAGNVTECLIEWQILQIKVIGHIIHVHNLALW